MKTQPSRAQRIVSETRTAASAARGSTIPIAAELANQLEAIATYWALWFPSDPSPQDKATLLLVRAINAAYAPLTPDADRR